MHFWEQPRQYINLQCGIAYLAGRRHDFAIQPTSSPPPPHILGAFWYFVPVIFWRVECEFHPFHLQLPLKCYILIIRKRTLFMEHNYLWKQTSERLLQFMSPLRFFQTNSLSEIVRYNIFFFQLAISRVKSTEKSAAYWSCFVFLYLAQSK